MKQACKIEVKSIRRSVLGEQEFSPDRTEEFWDQVEADGQVPEDFYDTDGTDREGDALFMQPDPPEPAESVLTSYGAVDRVKDGTVRISYEDSEITGLPGCLTTFCIVPDGSVILLRRGEVRTCMIFRQGSRQLCEYGTEGNVPSVILHTHTLESEIGESGGRVFVEYSVEIRGTVVERNIIDLSLWITSKKEA